MFASQAQLNFKNELKDSFPIFLLLLKNVFMVVETFVNKTAEYGAKPLHSLDVGVCGVS
jgi:hypothetical protein